MLNALARITSIHFAECAIDSIDAKVHRQMINVIRATATACV